MLKKLIAAGLIALVPFLGAAYAENLAFDVQAALVAKLLAFDKNIDSLASGGRINIGIVHDGRAESAEAARNFASELAKIKAKNVKIKEYDFQIHTFSYGGADSLAGELRAKGVSVLYIVTGSAGTAAEIHQAAGSAKVLTITGGNVAESVKKGIIIGLDVDQGKPVIMVNLESALKEGRDFSPQFLSLVKIVK